MRIISFAGLGLLAALAIKPRLDSTGLAILILAISLLIPDAVDKIRNSRKKSSATPP